MRRSSRRSFMFLGKHVPSEVGHNLRRTSKASAMGLCGVQVAGCSCGSTPVALVDSLKRVRRDIRDGGALKQVAREVRWAGNAVRCVCCGWRGRAFRPSCHDRPGAVLLCARCMSDPNDRAMLLELREISESLPMGARILDVEPSRYTRRWFSRFNQFDYRTLGRSAPDVEIRGDLTSVTLTKGICHLIVCSQGIDRDLDLMAAALALHRLTGAGGTVLVSVPAASSGADATTMLQHALEEVGFTVTADDRAWRLTPEAVRRFGLVLGTTVLVCTTDQAPPTPQHTHQH
jgi:hypothetical protein